MAKWKRVKDCLLCGRDRCLENRDEVGVGYCYRFGTMHRKGKPFIKAGGNPSNALDSFEGGLGETFRKVSPKNNNPNPSQLRFPF